MVFTVYDAFMYFSWFEIVKTAVTCY